MPTCGEQVRSMKGCIDPSQIDKGICRYRYRHRNANLWRASQIDIYIDANLRRASQIDKGICIVTQGVSKYKLRQAAWSTVSAIYHTTVSIDRTRHLSITPDQFK